MSGPSATLKAPDPKDLASNDKKTRDRALRCLRLALSGGKEDTTNRLDNLPEANWESYSLDERFTETEMARLWKGLFYCFWMSDKPIVQQALAEALASLILDIRPMNAKGRPARVSCACAFLRGFWQTICREWSGIDRLRTDKFYLLMRRYIIVSLRLLAREDWDQRAIAHYNQVLIEEGGPLCVEDAKTPLSIVSHCAEVFISSLAVVANETSSASAFPIPLVDLIQPYIRAVCRASSKRIYDIVMDNVFEKLVDNDSEMLNRSVKRRRLDAEEALSNLSGVTFKLPKEFSIRQAVLRALFDQAAQPTTAENNRRKVYALWLKHGGLDESANQIDGCK